MEKKNIFINAFKNKKIASEIELKRMFWKLAKKLHPDINNSKINNELFISLKSQFDEAFIKLYDSLKHENINTQQANRAICMDLFIDLIASNFPIDIRIRDQNKIYCTRLKKLNIELGRFGKVYHNLIYDVESELYKLRGKTIVSNHEFNYVKLYFYRVSDYYYLRTKNTQSYLRISYHGMINIFQKKNMNRSIFFLNWLIKDQLESL